MGCTSVEELVALGEKYGISITAEEAEDFLDSPDEQELSDEDLEQVAGGAGFHGILPHGVFSLWASKMYRELG